MRNCVIKIDPFNQKHCSKVVPRSVRFCVEKKRENSEKNEPIYSLYRHKINPKHLASESLFLEMEVGIESGTYIHVGGEFVFLHKAGGCGDVPGT